MQFLPFLNKGDKIGIACTARSIDHKDLNLFSFFVKQEGYEVVLADNIGKAHHRFAGNDAFRAASFQKLLDDPTIKVIVCARGGYGTTRILPLLNWDKFMEHPKWICGFSDVTALHGQLNRLGVVSVHSSMLYHPEKDKEDVINELDLLFGLLTGDSAKDQGIFTCTFDILDDCRDGVGEGPLVGGNLTMINNIIGTDYDFNYDGAILLLEDVDEYYYNIDRMIRHLKACGIFGRINGLIVGDFTNIKDDMPRFGETIPEIIYNAVGEYSFPVLFYDGFGHVPFNEPLILGAMHHLSVDHTRIEDKAQLNCFIR